MTNDPQGLNRRFRIGFISPVTISGYTRQILTSLWACCGENRCDLLPIFRDVDEIEHAVAEYAFDGVLIYNRNNISVELVKRLRARGTPAILLSSVQDESPDFYIGYSNERIMADAVNYLTGLGHRQIGFVIDRRETFPNNVRCNCFMYLAVPGTRDGGFGDLSEVHRTRHAGTMKILASLTQNPYLQWYADRIGPAAPEAIYIEFLRASREPVTPQVPDKLPTSRCFRGNGLAVLNSDLVDGKKNVQVQFKSNPGGTASHGYDANNSFLLNVFGERLLIRSGRRDMSRRSNEEADRPASGINMCSAGPKAA